MHTESYPSRVKCGWCRSTRFHVAITADAVDLECVVCHSTIISPRPDRKEAELRRALPEGQRAPDARKDEAVGAG